MMQDILQAISRKTEDLFVVEFTPELTVPFRLPPVRVAKQYSTLVSLANIPENTGLRPVIYEHIFRSLVEDSFLANHKEDIPAGIVDSIVNAILYLSGEYGSSAEYTDILWNSYRQQVNDPRDILCYMQRLICMVFPGYKFSDLDNLNYQEIVRIFINAEKILLERGIIEKEHSLTLLDESGKSPEKIDVDRMIKEDLAAWGEMEGIEEDPLKIARQRKIRETMIEKAKKEEREFWKQHAR